MATVYTRRPAALAAELGADEVVLLDEARENYFGLNDTASAIWKALEQPRTLEEICLELGKQFEVDDLNTMRQDVSECLAELMRGGLIAECA